MGVHTRARSTTIVVQGRAARMDQRQHRCLELGLHYSISCDTMQKSINCGQLVVGSSCLGVAMNRLARPCVIGRPLYCYCTLISEQLNVWTFRSQQMLEKQAQDKIVHLIWSSEFTVIKVTPNTIISSLFLDSSPLSDRLKQMYHRLCFSKDLYFILKHFVLSQKY